MIGASGQHHANRIALVAGPLAIAMLMIWFSSWTGDGQPSAAPSLLWVLASSVPTVLAWLGAAAGFGWPLCMWLAPKAQNRMAIQAGLGIATLLIFDAGLGALGWLQLGGTAGAWILIIIGMTLALAQIGRELKESSWLMHAPSWLFWLAAPSIAVLLVASCSAPGWLWASEFGGYDAMSYHLQLPKEWMALGRIEPLKHNVYSFMPGYVEAAYYHIALLRGTAIDWVYACQLLHASIAVLSAGIVARLVRTICPSGGVQAEAIAFVGMLATPWIIVTGSLAYNDMLVVLMLGASMIVLAEREISPARTGIILGLLFGAACGGKLTAAGMLVLPVGIVSLQIIRPRQWAMYMLAGLCAGLIALLPYLMRNFVHAGQPLFPFATNFLGTAHWSPEQAHIWNDGHHSHFGIARRLHALWHEFYVYGVASNPNPAEPWKPHWSFVSIAGTLALLLNLIRGHCRTWAIRLSIVLALQLAFWLAFTHLKSRFLLPCTVPLVCGLALLAAWRPMRSMIAQFAIALSLMAASFIPAILFKSERSAAPAFAIDYANQLTGEALPPDLRQGVAQAASPTVAINYALPVNAKTLLIGQAAPLYFDLDKITYNTTWDRGPFSELIRDFPDTPARWFEGLKKKGFTHVLVDEGMLRRWEHSGWNDPVLTVSQLNDYLSRFATIQNRYPNAITLYKLE